MNDLERLREKMSQSFDELRFRPTAWGQPHLMAMALAEVKKAFDTPTSLLPERSIAKVLDGYRRSGSLPTFLDLKYACFGVGQELSDNWCLFDDDPLFGKLLVQVDGLRTEPRRFRKGYQGLLSSYFSYALYARDSQKNWEHLRGYLADRLPAAKYATPVASWLTLLDEHQNLLGPKPCERYVHELREGNKDVVVHQTLREGLGVPRESWVWQELVLSQIEVACCHDDQCYKEDLARLLRLLQANTMLSVNLVIRCVSMLVCRYAQCSSRPEHPALRDAAVSHIGNPWLKRTAWDAHVKNKDGQPYEAARQMVNGWIKRRLIKDFFELLSDDGSADLRRLNYWLRFEPVVEDMWFALGPHASKHPSPDFKDFRNRARGRLLTLEGSGAPQNNAFIMQLGTVTVVEFGSKGNAAYMYSSEEKMPFDLGKNWISMFKLKNMRLGKRFIHMGDWEEKIDEILCPLIGFRPSQGRVIRRREEGPLARPTPRAQTSMPRPFSGLYDREMEVLKYLKNIHNLSVDDRRPQGGALWVLMDNNTSEIYKLLVSEGFKYKPGKGWWKE
ncbi:MAG: hypothetical protein J0665_12075 [Deltaproteobacteria bacterium]|nr:hypothetical protein [Deltaproteobacteria bacterium]